MSGFGEEEFGTSRFGNTSANKVLNLFEFGNLIVAQPESDWDNDIEYKDDTTADGWLRPGNCPICDAVDWVCVTDAHYSYTAEEIRYVTEF